MMLASTPSSSSSSPPCKLFGWWLLFVMVSCIMIYIGAMMKQDVAQISNDCQPYRIVSVEQTTCNQGSRYQESCWAWIATSSALAFNQSESNCVGQYDYPVYFNQTLCLDSMSCREPGSKDVSDENSFGLSLIILGSIILSVGTCLILVAQMTRGRDQYTEIV